MKLTVIQDASPEEFLNHAGPLLYQNEPTNSLMLGLCGNLIRATEPPKSAPLLIRVLQNEKTVTAAIQTSLMNLIVTYASPNQLELLASELKKIHAHLPGVVGPAKESELFSQIWSHQTGAKSKLGMGQKIYKIEKVDEPNTPGSLRLAQPEEADLIGQWLFDFGVESLLPSEQKSLAERKEHAVKAIRNQLAYVWLVDGQPVSMAHVGRPTLNGISISGVYTPQALRKNGFASAVVAQLSQKMLDSGKKFCVLYTDLANSTSNKIYQKVGYREVSNSKHFLFK